MYGEKTGITYLNKCIVKKNTLYVPPHVANRHFSSSLITGGKISSINLILPYESGNIKNAEFPLLEHNPNIETYFLVW